MISFIIFRNILITTGLAKKQNLNLSEGKKKEKKKDVTSLSNYLL